MAGNTFGTLFRFTTWGESHGPAIGVVVDGVPPQIPLAEADIQQGETLKRPQGPAVASKMARGLCPDKGQADRVEFVQGGESTGRIPPFRRHGREFGHFPRIQRRV